MINDSHLKLGLFVTNKSRYRQVQTYALLSLYYNKTYSIYRKVLSVRLTYDNSILNIVFLTLMLNFLNCFFLFFLFYFF